MLFHTSFVFFDDFLHTLKHFKMLIKHRLRISAFCRSDLVVCSVSDEELFGIVGILINRDLIMFMFFFSSCTYNEQNIVAPQICVEIPFR